MKPSDFKENMSGKLVQGLQDYWAFVPFPLEPKLEFKLPLINALSNADRALSELAGIARNLPNPHLLIKPFMRREAVLSSRIEGTQASLSDLLFFEAANLREKEVPDVREVANYVRALEYGLKRMKKFPLSLRLIREIHAKLMEGVKGKDRTPGEFRRTQNWIGPPGCSLVDATYVPPPIDEMNVTLDSFEKYLHVPSDLPPIIRAALVHYQFESIHPFLDGNGRVGRLLITLLLCNEGILPQPLLYLSAYFERYREQYYHHLLKVSQEGLWNQWITFFLKAVSTQAKDAIGRSDRILELWHKYRAIYQEARSSALILSFIDELFTYPAITNRGVAERLGVTPRSAQLNIDKLIAEGILKEATGKRRNRIYVAPGIIEIIDES